MAQLPLQLPSLQNWSCHSCGGCCRQHLIEITPEERQRIESQHWTAAEGVPADRPQFVRLGLLPGSKRYRLGHQADGACVFLDGQGRCRIHAKFGEAAKPLACRIYPYAFHPAGKSITVSLRFSCPSVVANRGKSLESQKRDLKALEKLVVPEGAERMPPPEISPRQRLDWPETLHVVQQIDRLLAADGVPLMRRLLRTLQFVKLVGQAQFAKIRGPRLDDFLQIVSEAATAEVHDDLATISEPSRAGRMQFRLLVAQYVRKDTFAEQQSGWRNRWRLLWAALRFARGTGLVPPLQEPFVAVGFADLEPAFGPLPPEVDEIMTRYLRVKVQGLHFCGAAYYGVPLVEGFQSLALVVPAVLWIARWLAAGAGRRNLEVDDLARALAIADHHHGYSPAFGLANFRSRVRSLASLDDISKLIVWYAR